MYIFPVFDTEEWAEKIRSQPQTIDSEVPYFNMIPQSSHLVNIAAPGHCQKIFVK